MKPNATEHGSQQTTATRRSLGERPRPWRPRRAKRTRPGSTPGLLVVDPRAPRSRVRVLAYGPQGHEERSIEQTEEIRPLLERWPTVWVNVDGVQDVATIQQLGELFGLHRLALEDVVHLHQRAKLEAYDECLFLVARIVQSGEQPGQHHHSEQLAIFIGDRFVLTFQEHEGDPFEPVRERLRSGKGRIRGAGPDYLAYALLDAAIDLHFPLLEQIGDRLEQIEAAVLAEADETTLGALHGLRSQLLAVRRDLLPHRDLLHTLIREDYPQVKRSTHVYLRDCHDHVNQLIDLLEVYREVSSDLMGAYLTGVSNRMNDVMKVLTMIATIFIPLGFIAGIYGMNFDPRISRWNMPELGWRVGYPFALGLMLAIAAVMLLFFRRRGWLGGRRRPR